MHTNFGGVLRKAEISETFVTREIVKRRTAGRDRPRKHATQNPESYAYMNQMNQANKYDKTPSASTRNPSPSEQVSQLLCSIIAIPASPGPGLVAVEFRSPSKTEF